LSKARKKKGAKSVDCGHERMAKPEPKEESAVEIYI